MVDHSHESGSREATTAMVGRDPRHEPRLGSIGVATLDLTNDPSVVQWSSARRRRRGARGGRRCALRASAPRILPLLGDYRLRKGPRAFIIRSCCPAKPVSSLQVRVGYFAVWPPWDRCGLDIFAGTTGMAGAGSPTEALRCGSPPPRVRAIGGGPPRRRPGGPKVRREGYWNRRTC